MFGKLPFNFYNFVDINECTKAPKVCHQNVKGYSGDGKVNCTGTVVVRNDFIVVYTEN